MGCLKKDYSWPPRLATSYFMWVAHYICLQIILLYQRSLTIIQIVEDRRYERRLAPMRSVRNDFFIVFKQNVSIDNFVDCLFRLF